jgi:hypothetical protein
MMNVQEHPRNASLDTYIALIRDIELIKPFQRDGRHNSLSLTFVPNELPVEWWPTKADASTLPFYPPMLRYVSISNLKLKSNEDILNVVT